MTRDPGFWGSFRDLLGPGQTPSGRLGQERAVELTVAGAGEPSIRLAIGESRKAAQAVRTTLTTEVYEQLNSLYWRVEGADWNTHLYGFLRGVELGVQLLTGLVDDSMDRGEAWDFVRLGRYLERAKGVTRVVIRKSRDLARFEEDSLEWAAVLRCCSSFEAYRFRMLAPIRPDQVVSFLMLDRHNPRSAGFALSEALESVRRIDGTDVLSRPHRVLGRLAGAFEYADPGEVALAPEGFGAEFEKLGRELDTALGATYFRPSRIAAPIPGSESRPQPQQQQQAS